MKIEREFYVVNDEVPELVVGAVCKMACKKTGRLFAFYGARHFDLLMSSQMDIIEHELGIELEPYSQGFYTNKGRLVSREEALVIAKANNQIVRYIGYNPDELYSEMLY